MDHRFSTEDLTRCALILAGGRSSRMGTDKPLLKIGDETLLERAVRFWRESGRVSRILVANGQPGHLEPLPEGAEAVYDLEEGRGPMAGLIAAFRQTDADVLYVSAVDMPFLRKDAILPVPPGDACVYRCGGGLQPAFAVYRRSILPLAEKKLAEALFFVHQTVENGWSRDMLLNFMGTDLYERQGKALTNFQRTLPEETSDLARELTKDPYDFAFTGITGKYNEALLKEKLLGNITQFLVELGTGFGYLGKEYRLQVGEREQFIDLLFYNLNLSCYVVIEVKIGKFEFADIGQLGGYVVACNHTLRKEGRDNPTIGLLICKEKDRVQAQYALESSSQPLAISEYELEKFYPEKVEGTIPTIEEIEAKLSAR